MNQRLKNAFKHRFRPLKDFMVPEADHSKATPCQTQRTFEILEQTLGMLTAIQLDHQSRAQTDEVHYVRADRYLPAKSIAAQAPMSKVEPKAPFGIG